MYEIKPHMRLCRKLPSQQQQQQQGVEEKLPVRGEMAACQALVPPCFASQSSAGPTCTSASSLTCSSPLKQKSRCGGGGATNCLLLKHYLSITVLLNIVEWWNSTRCTYCRIASVMLCFSNFSVTPQRRFWTLWTAARTLCLSTTVYTSYPRWWITSSWPVEAFYPCSLLPLLPQWVSWHRTWVHAVAHLNVVCFWSGCGLRSF